MNYVFDEKIATPLCEIMGRRGSDKGTTDIGKSWHNYTTLYHRILKHLCNKPVRVFELGIGTNNPNFPNNMGKDAHIGASLYGWSEYFPHGEIFGADIDKDILFSMNRISTFYCDQTSPTVIHEMWSNHPQLSGNFDIILDDGYHTFHANVCFFENSIHKLTPGGYYIIEDIQNAQLAMFEEKIEEWKVRFPSFMFTLVKLPSTFNHIDNNVLVAHNHVETEPSKLATVHIIMYSDKEPFDTTKRLTLETIGEFTTKQIVIHNFDEEIIKTRPWFDLIKHLPDVKNETRCKYYYAYKAFCSWEVYQTMGENDILFYMDSSQYYQEGITTSIDKLCQLAYERGHVAGSVGCDMRNIDNQLCHKFKVWKKVLPECDETILMNKHVLCSWFLFGKNDVNTRFFDDWVKWSIHTDNDFSEPLISQHFIGDQAIFNMLVNKYQLTVFFHKDRWHTLNKDKNGVFRIINSCINANDLFVNV